MIKPGIKCSEICEELNNLFGTWVPAISNFWLWTFFWNAFTLLWQRRGIRAREDIDTVLKKNMVISMEPMIMIPEGT